ncbi:MAG: hypothetical protein J6J13_04170, partial [Clostridia bacterium]|nr:hypothetical protein [Clostridia bacterium]
IYDVKIDGKKYETWVKDKALDTLKTVAAYKTLCKKNKLEISNTDKTGAEAVIAEKWSNYSEIFSNNGVSQATYTQYRLDEYLAEVYFGHLYGKDGKKAVSADDIKKHLNENYVVANVIGEDLSSLEDEQKTDKKETINGYYNELIAGTKTFEEIYKTHYNITEEDTTTNETDDKPMDQYATAISKEEGGEHFNSIMEMNVGDIKILNGENDSDILLVIKKDINADPYYLNDADITIRHELKDKEFENDINKFKKTLKLEENKYATNRFKVKKIEYLETTA